MDGTAITFSTAEIRKKPIKNFTMSNKLREELQFSVAPTNPEEELRCITSTVKQCIQRHPKLYSGSCSVWWSHAEDSNLRLAISFDHRTNGMAAFLSLAQVCRQLEHRMQHCGDRPTHHGMAIKYHDCHKHNLEGMVGVLAILANRNSSDGTAHCIRYLANVWYHGSSTDAVRVGVLHVLSRPGVARHSDVHMQAPPRLQHDDMARHHIHYTCTS